MLKKLLYFVVAVLLMAASFFGLDYLAGHHAFAQGVDHPVRILAVVLVSAVVAGTAWVLYEVTERLRFRYVYMMIGSLLTLAALFVTSPDQELLSELSYGASFIATIVLMLRSVLYVAVLHYSRKALFDYIDIEALYDKAKQEPLAAGVAMLAVTVSLIPVSLLIVAAVGS